MSLIVSNIYSFISTSSCHLFNGHEDKLIFTFPGIKHLQRLHNLVFLENFSHLWQISYRFFEISLLTIKYIVNQYILHLEDLLVRVPKEYSFFVL